MARRNGVSRPILPALCVSLIVLGTCGKEERANEPPPAAPPPAVPQPAALVPPPPSAATATEAIAVDFEGEQPGDVPSGFSAALSGKGPPGVWQILEDRASPAGPAVAAQTDGDRTSQRFPVLILDAASARDVELSVRFKPISGDKDQAAGLIWRYQDPQNYYVVRANALEDNVVLYKMEQGKRSDLDVKGKLMSYGVEVEVPLEEWGHLAVHVAGDLFTVYLNGEELFEVEDSTFSQEGKIGLWTKADSVTWFDDLRAVVKDSSETNEP